MNCPNCSAVAQEGTYCSNCAFELPKPLTECPACGAKGVQGNFCFKCASPLQLADDCKSCGARNQTGNFCKSCGENQAEVPAPDLIRNWCNRCKVSVYGDRFEVCPNCSNETYPWDGIN